MLEIPSVIDVRAIDKENKRILKILLENNFKVYEKKKSAHIWFSEVSTLYINKNKEVIRSNHLPRKKDAVSTYYTYQEAIQELNGLRKWQL